MERQDIDSKWIREIIREEADPFDRYTFCGALELRYEHIAINWNKDTRRKYDRLYNGVIIPSLVGHDEKTIGEYTKDDFNDAISRIKENGYIEKGVKRYYSESSLHTIENLIYYVVYQSSVYGLCDNVLWGSRFMLDIPDEQEEILLETKIKKSLTVAQEKKLYEELLTDITEDGAFVALLLMWGLGLRNAEACGLNYGDIKPLEDHTDCYTAWIYKTTKIASNELQSGGKTVNTGRIIPVPDMICSFLYWRRCLIVDMIAQNRKTGVSVDDLPICCDGSIEEGADGFLKRCSAREVTSAAVDVFTAVGITPRLLAYLDQELSEGNTAKLLKEKEPTAYLLRRNYATQMSVLGLTVPEMQYLIGHDVEDAYESRNEYVDNDRIYEMAKKLRKRSLLNNYSNNNAGEVKLPAKKTVKVRVTAREPEDAISVDISAEKDISTTWFEEEEKRTTFPRTIDIFKDYWKLYKN